MVFPKFESIVWLSRFGFNPSKTRNLRKKCFSQIDVFIFRKIKDMFIKKIVSKRYNKRNIEKISTLIKSNFEFKSAYY